MVDMEEERKERKEMKEMKEKLEVDKAKLIGSGIDRFEEE